MGSSPSFQREASLALPFKGRVGWGWCCVFGFSVVARTDSRPCVVCRPSMAASYFLLLAQKKVTKENGTLGFAPLAERAVRYGRTGSAHRPSMARCPNRRDPSRRPRAGHAAGPSALRRCSEGTRRAKRKKETDVSDISDVAYIRCFCGRDCRALLFRVPSRPRQGLGGKAAKRWPAGCRPLRREHTDVLPAKPSESLRSRTGMDARATADARACSLWLLSLARARESDSAARMAVEKHTDVSRLSRQRHNPNANTIPTQPSP